MTDDRLRLAAQEALYAHDNPSMVPDKSRVWDALRRALAEHAPCPECGHDAGHHSWSVDGWLCVEAGCPCKRKHTDG